MYSFKNSQLLKRRNFVLHWDFRFHLLSKNQFHIKVSIELSQVIVIFYLRKISALRNVRPPQKVVLTSQSSSMVNAVFLVSLVFVFVFVGLVIFQFKPSDACGPFRGTAVDSPLPCCQMLDATHMDSLMCSVAAHYVKTLYETKCIA